MKLDNETKSHFKIIEQSFGEISLLIKPISKKKKQTSCHFFM